MRVPLFIVTGAAQRSLSCAPGYLHLSLQEAERIAVQNNPQVSAARYNAEASKEIPKELRSNYQPTVFGTSPGSARPTGAASPRALEQSDHLRPLRERYRHQSAGDGFGRTANLIGSAQSRALAQQENSNATRAQVLVRSGPRILLGAASTGSTEGRGTDGTRPPAGGRPDQHAGARIVEVQPRCQLRQRESGRGEAAVGQRPERLKASTADLPRLSVYPNQQNFVLSDEPLAGAAPGGCRKH